MKTIKAGEVVREDLLLDVRTHGEFGYEYIEGSECDPLSGFDAGEWAARLDGSRRCVVVCQGGVRAKQAAARLEAAGAKNVVVLEGGVNAWKAAGKECRRGERRVLPLDRQVRIATGMIVLSGVILGAAVNPLWYLLAGCMGAGMIFAGVTNWCGLAIVVSKMPWNVGGVKTSCSTEAGSCCGGEGK